MVIRDMPRRLVEPGERHRAIWLPRTLQTRLEPRFVPRIAEITRGAARHRITVPAGAFEVERWTVNRPDQPPLSYDVEVAPPHRIIRWAGPGERAELTGTTRMAYWQRARLGDVELRAQLGLRSAPPPAQATPLGAVGDGPVIEPAAGEQPKLKGTRLKDTLE